MNRFAATTGQEFTDALHKLQKQGMKDLILDLQGNGGGYLNAAIILCDQILGKKELIVYTEGRRNPHSEFEANGPTAISRKAVWWCSSMNSRLPPVRLSPEPFRIGTEVS